MLLSRFNVSILCPVPRYENAAKSNYWTMTREGFEEFGNENSFKRRRRRAALTPISTYKTKKQSEGMCLLNARSCSYGP